MHILVHFVFKNEFFFLFGFDTVNKPVQGNVERNAIFTDEKTGAGKKDSKIYQKSYIQKLSTWQLIILYLIEHLSVPLMPCPA